MTAPWSQSELDEARSQFLFGLPLKIIARNLGRSPTAVNKALSRHGIRSMMNNYRDRLAEKPPAFPAGMPVTVTVRALENFYIRRGGYVLSSPEDKNIRIVNGEPLTVGQMLLQINACRDQDGLPPFVLTDATP